MSPVSFVVALTVVIATLSVSRVGGYTYYYYYYQHYYYADQPKLCAYSYYNPNTIKTCPISSCHCSLTYADCCLRYFTYNGVMYKQCICSSYTTCAPTNSTIDNPPPQTTQSSTTTTTPTTTTTSTTPTTTSTTTTTTTPTATSTTTTPTTTSTTTTPTTTSTTTTPTTTSTTTTPTTTSTTTTPTTTSTTTTPTTTATTTTPTTTSTTDSTTTTPLPFRSLCDSGFRLLNGDSATTCDFNGVANITMMDGALAFCNAVYAYATVNGVYKLTFITSSMCTTFIETQNTTTFEIQIGTQRYPVIPPIFTLVEGPDGVSFIDINRRYEGMLSDLGCQKGACAYNEATMDGKVDFNNCTILSFGVMDADSFSSDGLNKAKVALNPGGCTDIQDTYGAANTLCFKTISGDPLICSRDTGSPIYCYSPSNGESILVAISAFQTECNTSPDVKGLPYPG